MATIRAARPDEDEVLARLLYNAFRLNWCTNWEHNLSIPLPEIPPTPQTDERITGASAARLASWRATLSLTRKLGGWVDIVLAASNNNNKRGEEEAEEEETTPIAAVSCFLPPGTQPTFPTLLTSGCLLLPFRMGPLASYRFRKNYLLAAKLWGPALRPLGESLKTGGNVLAVGTNPSHAGKGYAGKLLGWQIARHRRKEVGEGKPVYLETTSSYAQRVYERLGFEEIVRGEVVLKGVDGRGLRIDGGEGRGSGGEEEKETYCAVRCMRLAPV